MEPISIVATKQRKFVALVTLLVVATSCIQTCGGLTTGKRPATTVNTQDTKRQRPSNTPVMNPEFENAGSKAGIEIWRIENFKPVPYPKDQYGKFYTGDSYIVLVTKEKANKKSWDIHYWLGSESTQDEYGTAAVLAVQLDDQLGGGPVQYREVQDHETQQFLSLFKGGVRYLPGGIKSGFQHVDRDAFELKLFQVKGSRNVRVKQVTPNVKSMNKGDCFILDSGKNIYVYVGEKSKRIEKIKAIAAANQIRDQDHAGKSKVSIIDSYGPQSDFDDFFKALGGGSKDQVADESVGGDDGEFEKGQAVTTTLYRVSDASGKLEVKQIAQKPLESSSLDPKDCFILDSETNLFVWVGKQCTSQERIEAMKKAESFLTSKNYPKWTQIQRVVQGTEPTAFTQHFKTWRGTGEKHDRLVRSPSSDRWEPRLFHCQIPKRGESFKTEQIFNYQQEDLNEDDIMLVDNGTELFVWVGNGASAEEKFKSQALAQSYLKKLNSGDAPITVIQQGKEPQTFKSLFPSWNANLWDNVKPINDYL